MVRLASGQSVSSESIDHLDFVPLFDRLEQAVAIPELVTDGFTRQKAAQFIGSCLADREMRLGDESHLDKEPIESLYDAIQKAAEGDDGARSMVKMNVATEAIELTQKVKHINVISQDIDQASRIRQHGQSQRSIQANSIRYVSGNEKMRPRVSAEVRNSFRVSGVHQDGLLNENAIMVISPAADNMSRQEAAEVGFFTDTMTCMIQLTTMERGELKTEVAMVAGVQKPGATRHDFDAIGYLGDKLGVDLHNKNAAQVIDTPVLIPKEMVSNGVSDLAKLYDDGVETKTGQVSFFGQRPEPGEPKNYQAIVDQSRLIQAGFEPKLEAATNELINLAGEIKAKDKLYATKTLHKVVEKHMVLQAIVDHDINPRVFGPAALNIAQARAQHQAGNYHQALLQTQMAIKNAVSASCPSGAKAVAAGGARGELSSSSLEDCQFVSKECPKCHQKNVTTTVRSGVYYGDCGCKS